MKPTSKVLKNSNNIANLREKNKNQSFITQPKTCGKPTNQVNVEVLSDQEQDTMKEIKLFTPSYSAVSS